MGKEVRFEGWDHFANTGGLFREWEFEAAIQTEGISAGDSIFDYGPQRDVEKRFQFRLKDDSERRWLSRVEAERLLGFEIPPWRVPNGNEEIATALNEIRKAVVNLTAVARDGGESDAQKRLGIIKNILGEVEGPDTAERTYHGVKLRGYFNYDSGSPYRIWTLTRDQPELRANAAWEEEHTGPPHAVAGDELWENREDRGKVFRLKRKDLVISRPEWWQVKDLFNGGLPAWGSEPEDGSAVEPSPSTAGPPAEWVEKLRRSLVGFRSEDPFVREATERLRPSLSPLVHRFPGPEYPYQREYEWDCDWPQCIWVATRAIEDAGIARGDFLVQENLATVRQHSLRCSFTVIDRQLFGSVLDRFDTLELAVLKRAGWGGTMTAEAAAQSCRQTLIRSHRAANRSKPETSPLVIIRPLLAPVSQPIKARSDDAALFELITQVGGKMPTGGA